jgi:hypothetical protein
MVIRDEVLSMLMSLHVIYVNCEPSAEQRMTTWYTLGVRIINKKTENDF